jgi:hypothetical protein
MFFRETGGSRFNGSQSMSNGSNGYLHSSDEEKEDQVNKFVGRKPYST